MSFLFPSPLPMRIIKKKKFGLYTSVLKVFYTWLYNRAHCPNSSYSLQDIILLSGDVSLGSQT